MKNLLFILAFLAITISGYSQSVLLEEYFNDPENLPPTFTFIDEDGDGQNWRINTWEDEIYVVSDSWLSSLGPLTPENYMVTPQIDLTGLSGTLNLRYTVQIADEEYFEEHYKVAVSTTGNQAADFTNIVFEETMTLAAYYVWVEREINLTEFLGESIYITWCHYNCTDMYKLLIDSIQVTHDPNVGIPEGSANSLRVYPNPVRGKLYISGDFSGASMALYSTDGRKVSEIDNFSGQSFIDVSGLENGFYVLRTETAQGVITRKISVRN